MKIKKPSRHRGSRKLTNKLFYSTLSGLFSICFSLLPATVTANSNSSGSSWNALGELLGFSTPRNTFLDPDRAFALTVYLNEDRGISAHWDIAPGYYLYRDKFRFRILSPDSVKAAIPVSPTGKKKFDEYFGEMEVYYHQLDIQLPLLYDSQKDVPIQLEINYQGCADAGFCYPPISKTIELILPPSAKEKVSSRATL